jgi:CheY-like chemotaxis protein
MKPLTLQSITRRALVLEDDPWVVPIIECALKNAVPGLEVDRVDSVEEAVRKTKDQNYEVIVADIFVKGGQTGVNFWDHCKKECPDSAILLTSSMAIEEFQKTFSHKRDNPLYIRKPLSLPELARTIQALFDFTGISS